MRLYDEHAGSLVVARTRLVADDQEILIVESWRLDARSSSK
jgi:hypothetical protein